MLIDGHTHVSPAHYPVAPDTSFAHSWPCMRCREDVAGQSLWFGDREFRALDDRSWDAESRIAEMDRDGVSIQILSPMPELLSYWLPADAAQVILDSVNGLIAGMVARHPTRFRGFGAIPLQVPEHAARSLRDLKRQFGLSGVEIGSNINGVLPGDPAFDPFWAAAEEEGMAVFVHALRPIVAKVLTDNKLFLPFVGLPVDIGMAAASILIAEIPSRFPALRLGLSHGGGAISSLIGRLDMGWKRHKDMASNDQAMPSAKLKTVFLDSNVYDPALVDYLDRSVSPGRVFAGSDYPYALAQDDLDGFIGRCADSPERLNAMRAGAALAFLGEGAANGTVRCHERA